MTKLSVNVNKIATLRNTRAHLSIPDLVELTQVAIEAGADGITIHPRPDERHIRSTDVDELAKLLRNYPAVEFNIEGNPFEGKYLEHCLRVRPHQCTLVPDSLTQSTSDHGWELGTDLRRLLPMIARLKEAGCRVSLFMDPMPDQMKMVAESGAERVELYTEPYAAKYAEGDRDALRPYIEAARAAQQAGLEINAGHDLSLRNLKAFLDAVPGVAEVSIGHALIADALRFGLAETVKRYLALCR